MKKGYHIYLNRHVFHDDHCIGKFDTRIPELVIHPDFADLKDKAKAFIAKRRGQIVPVRLAGEKSKAPASLRKFPKDVVAKMDKRGDMTPALIQHAFEKFKREQFEARYHNRITYDEAVEMFTEKQEAPVVPPVAQVDPSQVQYVEPEGEVVEEEKTEETVEEAKEESQDEKEG